MYNQTSIQSAISAALGDAPTKDILFDGRIHRFRVDRSADAGWYIAHSDEAVTFGDWRTGSKETWFSTAKRDPLQTAERIALDEQRAAARAVQAVEQERKARTAAEVATAIWNAASPAEGLKLTSIPAPGSPWRVLPDENPAVHPYLDLKQIGPHCARLLTPYAAAAAPLWIQAWIAKYDLIGSLIIPAGHAGNLTTLQFIPANGDKMNLPGGAKCGARCILGRVDAGTETICIVEGFATGASIHEATGLPVVVAFDAGNLATVAAGIRRDHPNARIIIAGDNDIRPAGSTLNNAGVVAARNAALRVAGTVAIPELAGKKCDWNDVAVAVGKDEVALQFLRFQSGIAPLKPDMGPELPTAAVAVVQLKDALDRFLGRVGTPEQQDMAICAAAGLGKTIQALLAIYIRGLSADYFVPSHKLAAEQVDRLPAGSAIAIRGRDHKDEAHPIPLCAKHEAATALQEIGLGSLSAPLLCGKIDPATGQRPCPHAAGCGYLQQFASTAPIRFYAHEWLPLPERSNRTPDVVVIDESFRDALDRHRSWEIADLFDGGSLYRTLSAAIADGNLIEVATPHLAAIDAAIDASPLLLPDVHPEMSAGEALVKIAGLEITREGRRISFLRNVKRAVDRNEPLSVWYVKKHVRDQEEIPARIHAGYTSPIKFVAATVPRLYLDASMNHRILDRVSPGIEIIDIAARRNAHVVQVADTPLAKWRLMAEQEPQEAGKKSYTHLSSRIIEFVTRKAGENPNGSIIAPKDWLDAHGAKLPTCVKQGHFGALLGLNEFEGCDWQVQVGRNEPPSYAVESIARAWFAGDPEFKVGTVTREQSALVARNGDTATVKVTAFVDRRCQEILEGIREQESLQAVDRLRLIHATKPKTIYLLCNLPLPGLPPDELVSLDDLLLPGRIAEVMLRDGAVVGPAALAARHPDLFISTKAAKEHLGQSAAGLNSSFPYKASIRERSYLNIATYRVNGTVGKARRALLSATFPPEMVAGLLADIHSAPVTILGIAPRITSPGAHVPPAAVPILPDPSPWVPPAEEWVPFPPDPAPWVPPAAIPILPDPAPWVPAKPVWGVPIPPTADRPYTIYPNRYAFTGIPA